MKKISELDTVTLKDELLDVPAGSTGTVVYVYIGKDAYEVEFIMPDNFSVVKTLTRNQLK